jgi:hypothetical protein
MAVSDWSTTAADNDAAPPSGAPEGMAPSAVNDVIRQMMADLRTAYNRTAFTDTALVTSNASAAEPGFKGLPANTQGVNYTTVLSDAGKMLLTTTSGITFTIAAHASVAYPIGTALTFVNGSNGNISIAINTEALALAGTGSTGTRTLASSGMATAVKITNSIWYISGAGLS